MERIRYASFDGLDATGKTTLTEMLQSKLNAVILKTPPQWICPVREIFNKQKIEMRFLYYAFGNLWVDKFVLKPLLNDCQETKFVLQDRSWISTLSAHELRGMSTKWLNFGLRLAKTSTKPDCSFILHVNPDVRYQRLMGRGLVNETDLQNMKFENQIEGKYIEWASKLGWNSTRFDNTHYSVSEACEAITEHIQGQSFR